MIVLLYHYQNYWNFAHECKRSKHKIAFRARKVIDTFEKRALLDCQVSAVTRSFSQLISVLANKCQDVLDKFSPAWVASVSVWFRSKERPVLDGKEMKREPFFAQSLTLVPRFLLLSRKETLATQAKFSQRFQLVYHWLHVERSQNAIVGFHMTSLKFTLRNYRSYRDFTFMM